MYILAFIVCLLATVVGAITGIGGGIVIKPVLELTGIMSVGALSFLSGLSVLAMTSVNLARKSGRAAIRERSGVLAALGGAAGGVLGKALFQMAGAGTRAGLIQSVALGILTLLTILYIPAQRSGRVRTLRVDSPLLCVAVWFALGMLSAFLGIGGGPVNIMALSFFFSLDAKRAGERSLLIIFFSQLTSILSALITRSVPPFDWAMLIAMVSAGVLGGFVGGHMRARFDVRQTTRVFMGLMWAILLICCVNAVRHAAGL